MKRILIASAIILVFCGCNSRQSSRHYSASDNHIREHTDNYEFPFHAAGEDYLNSAEEGYDDQSVFYTSGNKYNYKNGSHYNYDIEGYDEDGNYVSGNVDIDRYGDGYIEDEYGNEKYIEVEWTDWGVMEGYDEDGRYYELTVE